MPAVLARPRGGLDPDVAITGVAEQPDGFVLGVPGERPGFIFARRDRGLVAPFIARPYVDAAQVHVTRRLGPEADVNALAGGDRAHLDNRRARRMLRLR